MLLACLFWPWVAATGGPIFGDDRNAWHAAAVRQPLPASPELSLPSADSIQLVLDDGTAEGEFGVGGVTSRQFMWFNHFSPERHFSLEQIWVLFPGGGGVSVGDAIDLVVYRDADGDPTNGAELLAVIPEVVRQTDGGTFSIYDLNPPIVTGGGGVYLGVIPRFIVSGISPAILPTPHRHDFQSAAFVGSVVERRSACRAAQLPPDDQIDRVDDLAPGNWMIRGFGRPRTVVDVPALSPRGLILFSLLLVFSGIYLQRHYRLRGRPRR